MRAAVFILLFFGCSLFAVVRGGRPEKMGAAVILIGGIASIAAMQAAPTPWRGIEPGLATIDTLMLIAFIWLALRASRYWPMAVAGLQAVIVAGHVLRFVDPALSPWQYWLSSALWSWPIVVIIGLATVRHPKDPKDRIALRTP